MTGAIEAELLAAVAADPADAAARMVYADWLEQAGDRRARFIRQHQRVAPLEPDHPDRRAGEEELSRERAGLDPAWLAVIEPERRHHYTGELARGCDCFVPDDDGDDENRNSDGDADGGDGGDGDDDDGDGDAPPRWREPELHREPQDTECEAWHRLLDYVDRAAVNGTLRFQPRPELTAEQWRQIVTLPPTIAKLTSVTSMDLYGSHLVRIPPEIGAMASLRSFSPYTSYRLHWFPYEITRCPALRGSTVSTRALYGNFMFRPPVRRVTPPAPR